MGNYELHTFGTRKQNYILSVLFQLTKSGIEQGNLSNLKLC